MNYTELSEGRVQCQAFTVIIEESLVSLEEISNFMNNCNLLKEECMRWSYSFISQMSGKGLNEVLNHAVQT